MGNVEKQKIAEAEMQNLLAHMGKEVTVNGILYEETFEHTRVLTEVVPYCHIEIWDGMMTVHNSFIGLSGGITKITEKETGMVLYENPTFVSPERCVFNDEEKLAHMNKMREEKYGTTEYNAKDLNAF